jgi:toxin ParE1/3/4
MASPLKLRWTPRALHHLRSARDYVAKDNVAAADRLVQSILAAVESLQPHPELGRKGRAAATRELVIPGTPYIVVYRLRPSHIQILAVFHAARRWPDSF